MVIEDDFSSDCYSTRGVCVRVFVPSASALINTYKHLSPLHVAYFGGVHPHHRGSKSVFMPLPISVAHGRANGLVWAAWQLPAEPKATAAFSTFYRVHSSTARLVSHHEDGGVKMAISRTSKVIPQTNAVEAAVP